jgi:hypothetical protein
VGPGGHCRYPIDQVTPHTGLSPRQGRRTATCTIALDPASLLGRAPALSRVPRLWILPPCSGGLRRCHVSRGARSCVPAQDGSDAVMCPTALDPASLLRRALALPHVPRLWIMPPCLGGLRRCHVSRGSKSCFPALEGSGATTCPTAPGLASLLERAPVLPRVPQFSVGRRSQD